MTPSEFQSSVYSALTALPWTAGDGGVHYSLAPAGTDYPFTVFSIRSTNDPHNSGRCTKAVLTVNAYTDSNSKAHALMNIILGMDNAVITGVTGFERQAQAIEPIDGKSSTTWRATANYVVWYEG